MSGGHYDYDYFKIDCLIDKIQTDLDNNFTFGKNTDWEGNYVDDLIEKDKKLFIKKVKKLIKNLKKCSDKAKDLEWFLSGDTYGTEFMKD